MFITFEGPDGSGKSTQLALLVEDLRARGHAVFQTREPGGTPIGDQIRAVVHDLQNRGMHPHTEILLYAASRAQLVAQEIRPRLAAGQIVACDRYADSTLAYQGYGRELDLPTLRTILTFATGGLQPDLTIYLDITAEEGLRRRQQAAQGGAEWNRLDAESLAFHRRVRDGYHALVAEAPDRWVALSGAGDREAIQGQIRAAVYARLPAPDTA
jgi:dTMP kinase